MRPVFLAPTALVSGNNSHPDEVDAVEQIKGMAPYFPTTVDNRNQRGLSWTIHSSPPQECLGDVDAEDVPQYEADDETY